MGPIDCRDPGHEGDDIDHLNGALDAATGPDGGFFILQDGGGGQNHQGPRDPRVTFVGPSPPGSGKSGLFPEFAFPAAGRGSAAGRLDGPTSIVRHPITGHLFISEAANRRISEFDQRGGFVQAFGWGVFDGADQFEVCTTSCQPGRMDEPKGYSGRLDINSAGELYAQMGGVSFTYGSTIQVFSVSDQAPPGQGPPPVGGPGARHTTSTDVVCTPNPLVSGGELTCTATVTDTEAGATTPKASVDFSTAGAGVFGGSGVCTLVGSGPSSTCRSTFTPIVFGSGSHPISVTGSYGGDDSHGASKDTTAPTVTGLQGYPVHNLVFSSSRFKAASSGGFFVARRNAPVGTFVTFKLDLAAKVRFSVLRPTPGREMKKGNKTKCVTPGKRNRTQKKCVRLAKLKGSFDAQGVAGTNRFRFTGRLRNKKLKPGRYVLSASAIGAGTTGPAARASFRIIP